MNRCFLLFILLFLAASSRCQHAGKILFVIDSIPLLQDPEEWNPITGDDIAEMYVISDKDSLRSLGWAHLDRVTYVFTRLYLGRPDSLKRIPSLKQMVAKDGAWHLHGLPYSGKYRDYYNSGRLQNEGNLVNGKLDGELKVYFKNGIIKSVSRYRNGVLHGAWNDYYKNGALMQTREFNEGRMLRTGKIFFINGQVRHELREKKNTRFDSSLTWYSTGKLKSIKVTRTETFFPSKKEEDLNYYTVRFYRSLNESDIKDANKNFYQIWLLDSTSADTHFLEGLLLSRESHFDEAIAQFDKALQKEPLMREALTYRALTRIRKNHFLQKKLPPQYRKNIVLTVEDIVTCTADEQEKICRDLQMADEIDPSDYYVMKEATAPILNFCRQMAIR